MAFDKFILACLVLGLALCTGVHANDKRWELSDSLPSLYDSYAAYCDPVVLKNWTCGFCQHTPSTKFVGFMTTMFTSVFGYVTIRQDEVHVVFRGSQCIYNWIDNLDFWWTPYEGVTNAFVHRGFYRAYKDVQSQTRANVAAALKSCPTCKAIRCAGHSLGGALATHAAADLSFLYAPNSTAPGIKLTTFGSPRVGDRTFSSWLQYRLKSSWRMTHNADPVPHLPPTIHDVNWHHVPTEIFEGKNPDSYKQCNGSGEDPTCANSILFPFNTKDHLTYMGVPIDAGKTNRCQANGPDCSVFMEKYNNMDWDQFIQDRLPTIRHM